MQCQETASRRHTQLLDRLAGVPAPLFRPMSETRTAMLAFDLASLRFLAAIGL
ncbi:hypothetical protein GCM10020229_32110 [Kitasatospora albolonga]